MPTEPQRPKLKVLGKDEYSTGHCMTCGLLMRWPRKLQEFRCTICATVNDLRTLGIRHAEAPAKGEDRKTSQEVPAKPISLDHTRLLVDECLRSFLTRKFCTSDGDQLNAVEHSAHRLDETYTRSQETRLSSAAVNISSTEYVPKYAFRETPTLRRKHPAKTPLSAAGPMPLMHPQDHYRATPSDKLDTAATSSAPRTSKIFNSVQEYIDECFRSFDNVSYSFTTRLRRSPHAGHTAVPKKIIPPATPRKPASIGAHPSNQTVRNIDPKLLLLADVAKNGTWWSGGRDLDVSSKTGIEIDHKVASPLPPQKSPHLNWEDLDSWYSLVVNPMERWPFICAEVCSRGDWQNPEQWALEKAEQEVASAQICLRKGLMKTMEMFLKRPGGRITDAEELRPLLILLENPLLDCEDDTEVVTTVDGTKSGREKGTPASGPLSGRHSRVIKRLVGLISNLAPDLHVQLVHWFGRYEPRRFIRIKDLIAGFLSYRLLRRDSDTEITPGVNEFSGLVPQIRPGQSNAAYHEELRLSQKASKASSQGVAYIDDWQVKSAARMLAILFEANNASFGRSAGDASLGKWGASKGRFLPPSDFYVSLADSIDLIADFREFERKGPKFTFCQYPFLLSIWAKTQILEHDVQRQMRDSVRDAFFDSIMRRRTINQFLQFTIRRECLVDDSLKAIGETLGGASEDAKKALRITFRGEEGIDGGGLRKEWFLLLVREVFSPDLGLFIYDEDSQYCYFNPYSFESSDQFYLVGAIMGLAIYNSTILDVPLPPFTFRKLLGYTSNTGQPASSASARHSTRCTLEDLSQYKPGLARGLRQLLEYDGDVEATFCRSFVIDVQRYDTVVQVPLCEGGENKAVTNKNRREFVDLYVQYLLDTSVNRQFEPFKRGFYNVCSGNAFGLFRPEEVELLIRGSDEALDIARLRSVAEYDNWEYRNPDALVDQVNWFWDILEEASSKDQRKLLLFITGSDRLPAAGASMMPLKILCLGDDCDRFPIARTCFNMLSIWRYSTKEKLRTKLWAAVYESEGFGLR